MRKIAFLHTKYNVVNKETEKSSGDRNGYAELTEELENHGFQVDFIAFYDRFKYDWKEYRLVHFLAYFEYALENRLGDAVEFIRHLQKEEVKTANDAKILLWNLDKKYLKDLQKIDIELPLTDFVSKGECVKEAVIRFKRKHDLDKIVLKPCIGADGFGVKLIHCKLTIKAIQMLLII